MRYRVNLPTSPVPKSGGPGPPARFDPIDRREIRICLARCASRLDDLAARRILLRATGAGAAIRAHLYSVRGFDPPHSLLHRHAGARLPAGADVPPMSGNRRRIGVVTTSRADYSHLYWPLRELAADPQVELGIFALGAHLSPEFGNTIAQIERDGFAIQARIECLLSSSSDTGMAKTIGLAILGLADAFTAWRPDLLLLIADRYETLAPASAGLAMRIPIAHIEGGEVSQGAIDDQVRNALTKLAHIHFTSTETARRRVIAMGEEPWRVHRAGAPSLDHLRRSALLDRRALESRLGLSLTPPTLLAAVHPVTILRDTTAEADAVFAALEQTSGQLIFAYPNADAGSHALIERARCLAANRPGTHLFINLDAVTYLSLLGQVDAMAGNSSSGIMEAASFALPAVNVGMRQQGRERGRNVIDAPAETAAILAAIGRALSPEFRAGLAGMSNPYGDGTAAPAIARVLAAVELDGLLIKQPAPLISDAGSM
jgi:UDP-N-acetylglucosamine 2-epimerase (non-hydrolysing)/GDP/UDP-N,N'-diacetylbacillosamine 2-epimerase (hydrolysing)